MAVESAPDITPIEHDSGGDHGAPTTAPSDAEATGLLGGVQTIEDPSSRRSDGDLAERPVRNFRDLGTDAPGEPPVIDWKDFGTDKDPTPVHPLSQHLLDEHSGPVRPFGETADKAELPAKPLGERAMAGAADLVRPKATPAAGDAQSELEPEINPVSHREDVGTHEAEGEHDAERTAGTNEHGVDHHDRDEEADEGGSSGGDHPEDDALLGAMLLPMAAMVIRDAEAGSDSEPPRRDSTDPEDRGPEDDEPDTPDEEDDGDPPEDRGDRNRHEDGEPGDEEPGDDGEGGHDNGSPGGDGGDDGGSDGNGPEDGEPGDEEPEDRDHQAHDRHDDEDHRGEDGEDHTEKGADVDTDTEASGDDDNPRVPRQRALEERALDGDTEAAANESTEDVDSEQEQSRIHAATLDELRDLADRARVVAPPGGGHSKLRVEEGGEDVGKQLADLYQNLREGSAEMPPVTNWREEITSPDKIRDGQIIQVANMRELDELMERVGGWMNQATRADRNTRGGAGEFKPGQWVNPNQKPSQQLSRIRDFKGRPFHGRMTNVEAMAVPASMQGTSGNARYFTVSAQLQTTGRAPEPERPTWIVGVRSGDNNQGPNAIQGRSGNIGRVPASAVAWRVQARARHRGTEAERWSRMHAIKSTMRH